MCSKPIFCSKVAQTLPSTIGKGLMALDHSGLGLENKFLENKSGRIFCVRQVYNLLYKILPTSLGTCKSTFYTYYTSHLRWNSTMRRCFIIQTSDRMQYFTILQYKLHSLKIQDDRSTRLLLPEPLKKFPKSPTWPAGCHFCRASCGRVF